MKFIVDLPLGGLAKWLRFLGLNTTVRSLSPGEPTSLPEPAPDTYLLTGQAVFQRFRRKDILVLAGAGPEAQLEEVVSRLKLSRRHLKPLSRCVRCNDPLVPRPREQVQGQVPDHVFFSQTEFYQCPRCHRLYWPGSHLATIQQKLEQALRRPRGGRSGRPACREGSIS
ncbi:MAG: Mut7-C RNAse domain-containing protein [Thermodesulfobacteriota bacterium]